jgi:DNA-binding NtrC family response regulator
VIAEPLGRKAVRPAAGDISGRREEKRRGMDIIVADRDFEQAREIAGAVEGMGGHVFRAGDLDRVCDIFRKRDIGMLILDTSVLEPEGFAVIDILRGFRKDVHIVVTTGTPSEEMEREVRSRGVVFYAPKPVDIYWIREIVHRSIFRESLHRSSP